MTGVGTREEQQVDSRDSTFLEGRWGRRWLFEFLPSLFHTTACQGPDPGDGGAGVDLNTRGGAAGSRWCRSLWPPWRALAPLIPSLKAEGALGPSNSTSKPLSPAIKASSVTWPLPR